MRPVGGVRLLVATAVCVWYSLRAAEATANALAATDVTAACDLAKTLRKFAAFEFSTNLTSEETHGEVKLAVNNAMTLRRLTHALAEVGEEAGQKQGEATRVAAECAGLADAFDKARDAAITTTKKALTDTQAKVTTAAALLTTFARAVAATDGAFFSANGESKTHCIAEVRSVSQAAAKVTGCGDTATDLTKLHAHVEAMQSRKFNAGMHNSQ
ncbi:hypothetical protein ERJ75_000294300 [Trypanosoma vivax]|uniref:Trypanosoma glutamic acid/alanine-rich protein domain-containing protein n=1 Tax=Trypanosoma vivax (strain Y486) TaxID=1055687 RepID=F9WTS3_TRYVY|nr:hypothetical protein ERJ75_000294300 [Trypanosoma vivax]CCD20968.1 hypothetical protein, conserved in T. vivax [Trypanosoma vivax Y486]|eukprot:CCD20968.1 hypothetical protein, conserved in T. vivax [Trypanosoma vivax Y486]